MAAIFDGVILNFCSAYAKLLATENGTDLLPDREDKPDWPACWDWDTAAGYSAEVQARAWRDHILSNPKFWSSLKPLRGAVEIIHQLNRLSSEGHEVIFISNRAGVNAKRQTEISLYNLGMYYPTVILASDKVPIIRDLGITFMIDDKLETMLELVRVSEREKWLAGEWFLLSAPYNREGRIPQLKVVSSVREALEASGLWK